jgi:hypothetical protein
MQIKHFTIAGGNKTALVWDCPENERLVKATELLSAVEQVGFVTEGEQPQLLMMGGELCINALIALAAHSGKVEGILTTAEHPEILYKNYINKTSIVIPLTHTKEDNVILFDGIGFICIQEGDESPAHSLGGYAAKYNLPAFGTLSYDSTGRIAPRVHVVSTDSERDETACGSGSVAAYLVTGHNEIIQPSGGTIVVHSDGETFSIEATVSRLA